MLLRFLFTFCLIQDFKVPVVKDVGVVVTVVTVLAVGVVSVVGAVELSVTHTSRAEYFQ